MADAARDGSAYFRGIAAKWEPVCEPVLESVPLRAGAMLPSELLLFASLCLETEVDLVVESGRKEGYSTEVLCRVGGWQVRSVERAVVEEADERLAAACGGRLALHRGDGRRLVPTLVDAARRTAVLLDGPKSTGANLMLPSIRGAAVFVGIHDVPLLGTDHQGNARRASIENGAAYFTDDPDYVARFGWYDRAWMDRSGYKSHRDFLNVCCVLGIFRGGRWDADR